MTTLRPAPEMLFESALPTLRKSRNWLPSVAVAVFVVGVAMAMFRIGLGLMAGTGRLGAGWAMTDFYSSTYYPVRALLEGGNPHDARWFFEQYPVRDGYGPFLPINLVLHLPFGFLTPEVAGQVYFVFSLLMAILLAALSLRVAGVKVTASLAMLVAGLILVSRAGHWTLLLGQPALLLACFCYLALIYARSSPLLGGLALSLAAYKPSFGVPLALILLVGGHARVVAAGAAIGLVLNVPLYWVLASRAGGFREFFENMIWNYQEWQSRPKNVATSNHRLIDADALISRFLGQPLGSGGQMLLALGIPVIAGLVIRRLDWSRQIGRDLSVAIACTALLLCTHHLGYDKVVLAAPLVALVARGLPSEAPPALRWVFLALYVIPALNWLTTDAVLVDWQGSRAAWMAISSINAVCLAALFLGYVGLALAHTTGRGLDTRPASAPHPA